MCARERKLTRFIKPMLTTPVDDAFDSKDWIFELKLDGYRAIAEIKKADVKLYSRNGLSFKEKYPPVVDALEKLKVNAVLDGEVVLLDDGKPNFQKLQHYSGNSHFPLVYYAFDILEKDGKNLRELPLLERKKILEKLLKKNHVIRYSDHIAAHGNAFFRKVIEANMEGIMAKKANSGYVDGIRTKEWLKIKKQKTQEAIIVGFTQPKGGRMHFGSLLLAQHSGKKLRYIGNAGTGFDTAGLKSLMHEMKPLVVGASPLDDTSLVGARGKITWIKPRLVCEVSYTELTNEGMLRHPVFKGLRSDKKTVQIKREIEMPKHTSDILEDDTELVIGRKKVEISNPDKVYWPDENISKGELIRYYQMIAPYMIPYLKDRPMSLKRNPNGLKDEGFFQKDAGELAPSWMKTAKVYSESTDKDIHYLLCNDAASLVFIANLGCIEMNPWNSRVGKLDKPDYLVMDIDPSDKNDFDDCVDAAKVIKEILDSVKVPGYCKTSGASGLHVYIPLHAKYEYERVKDFAHLIATLTTEQLPDLTTLERSLSKRAKNKIYVDYLQNRRGQTLAAAYSVRPKPGATVSTPLDWKEVKHGLHPSDFTIFNIEKRIRKKGDLFEPVLGKGADIMKALRQLDK